MTTIARSLRLTTDLDHQISQEAEKSGKSRSKTMVEMLREALRMRRVPGIVFTDGATGRRATLAGTGLDVWEVIDLWKEVDEDFDALVGAADWLTEPQLRAALGYYELYPEEIDERREIESSWTPERLERELPFLRSRRTPG